MIEIKITVTFSIEIIAGKTSSQVYELFLI